EPRGLGRSSPGARAAGPAGAGRATDGAHQHRQPQERLGDRPRAGVQPAEGHLDAARPAAAPRRGPRRRPRHLAEVTGGDAVNFITKPDVVTLEQALDVARTGALGVVNIGEVWCHEHDGIARLNVTVISPGPVDLELLRALRGIRLWRPDDAK